MKKALCAGLLCIGVLGLGGIASGATLTLYPNSPGVAGVTGVSGPGNSAPGFGDGSFQAGPLDASGKSEIYLTPQELGLGANVTVGQIAAMSYFTSKAGASTNPDWSLYIYTNKSNTPDDTGSFYQSRLTAEPAYSDHFNPPVVAPNDWHQWSTTDLTFYDAARSGAQGQATDPTLNTLQVGDGSGNYTWASTGKTHNYDGETIEFISLQTGSGWAGSFNGLLDGFDISLTNGDTAAVNFEALPLPGSVWAGLALLGGLGLTKLRRRKSIA